MTTPSLLEQQGAHPVVPRPRLRPDPLLSLTVALLVLVVAGLLVCAVLATYTYNTGPGTATVALATTCVFFAAVVLNVVVRGWRHLRRRTQHPLG